MHTPWNLQGLDIGPDSVKLIQDTLADAQTVLWNGAHAADAANCL